MNETTFNDAVDLCTSNATPQTFIFNSMISNLILMLVSFIFTSVAPCRNFISMLPNMAAFFCFAGGALNYISWIVFDHVSIVTIVALSWLTDVVARICLIIFSYERIRNMTDFIVSLRLYCYLIIIYLIAFLAVLLTDTFEGYTGFLGYDGNPLRSYIVGSYFVSGGLYYNADLFIIPMDLYLGYLVVFVAKSKIKHKSEEEIAKLVFLLNGAGVTIILSAFSCLTLVTLRYTGLDQFYIYYQVIYAFRICMIQIFNVKLAQILSAKLKKVVTTKVSVQKVLQARASRNIRESVRINGFNEYQCKLAKCVVANLPLNENVVIVCGTLIQVKEILSNKNSFQQPLPPLDEWYFPEEPQEVPTQLVAKSGAEAGDLPTQLL